MRGWIWVGFCTRVGSPYWPYGRTVYRAVVAFDALGLSEVGVGMKFVMVLWPGVVIVCRREWKKLRGWSARSTWCCRLFLCGCEHGFCAACAHFPFSFSPLGGLFCSSTQWRGALFTTFPFTRRSPEDRHRVGLFHTGWESGCSPQGLFFPSLKIFSKIY